jgi:hypothetical protein
MSICQEKLNVFLVNDKKKKRILKEKKRKLFKNSKRKKIKQRKFVIK